MDEHGRRWATAMGEGWATVGEGGKIHPSPMNAGTERPGAEQRRRVAAGRKAIPEMNPTEQEAEGTLAGTDTLTRSSLDQYLAELRRFPPLSGAEEAEAARLARAGDSDALERLVGANLRFVVAVAKKFRGRGMAFEDLIAAGNVGLLTAARKFEAERGHKFISYAVHWIRQAIMAALAEHGQVMRLPINRGSDLVRVAQAIERMQAKLGREPTPGELAKDTGLSLDVVQSLAALRRPAVRLGAPRHASDDDGWEVDLTDERSDTARQAMDAARLEVIERALSSLPSRQAKVLRLRYGLGEREHTLEEIGTLLGVSRERARQLNQAALDRLRCDPGLAAEAGHEPSVRALGRRKPTKRGKSRKSELEFCQQAEAME